MGLSSSQGRLLMLTSRLSDIELAEIMISQRQNQLAWDSEVAAAEYNDALSNYKLTIKVTDPTEEKGYLKQDLSYHAVTTMGYLVTNSKNQIYLEKDDEGKWIIPKDMDGNPLLEIDEETGKAVIKGQQYDILDGTNYLSNPQVLQNAILNGVLFLSKFDKEVDSSSVLSLEASALSEGENDSETANIPFQGLTLEMLQASTEVEYVLDTSDDAEAQSKYEYEMARISRLDNQLDMELQQLETQHEAILKEYESVKKVISNNVDRTFKLFSDG